MDDIVINGSRINVEELSDEGKSYVARLTELQDEIMRTDRHRDELEVLATAYANSIKQVIDSAESAKVEVVN